MEKNKKRELLKIFGLLASGVGLLLVLFSRSDEMTRGASQDQIVYTMVIGVGLLIIGVTFLIEGLKK